MVGLTSLWLPILLSAVIVFIASSLLHMVLQTHKGDYKRFPDEDKLREAVRSAGAPTGTYMFPHLASHKEMANPEACEKFKTGPIGILTVLPTGMPRMGKFLSLWFVFCLYVGIFVAYLTGRTVAAGAPYLEVFRVAGTVAFLGYAGMYPVESIWKGQAWGTTLKHMFDGLIYGLLTAGVFGWLWPR